MAFMQVELFSQALHMAVGVDLILPQPVKNEIGMESGEKTEKKYPTLWLLHGATDDQTTWQRRTSIERYVAPLGIAVVMPSAHLSSYTDMAHGGAFYTYIVEELPVLMRQFFPLSEKREDNYVAGNSMGGYGAMKIGINNPDRYAAIGCFSAGANGGKPMPNNSGMFDDDKWNLMNFMKYGGKDWIGTAEDTFYMAQKNKNLPQLLGIFHTCGTEDFLIEKARETRDLFQSMVGNPYHYVYEEHKGIHGWDYWDEHITDFLKYIIQLRNS